MNTESAIEYIRRSSALRWKNSFFLLELLYMPLLSCGFMAIGKMVGGFCYASGIGAVVSCILHLIALAVLLRKSSPVKNKFILHFTSCINTFFMFSFFYTAMHYGFNLPEKDLVPSFVLSAFVPFFLVMLFSALLKRPTLAFRKKTKITYTSISYYVTGTAALIRFLIAYLLKEYGQLIGERVLELTLMYFIQFVMLVLSSSILDLQRYYYFTKLEKQGLVTEDILKTEE